MVRRAFEVRLKRNVKLRLLAQLEGAETAHFFGHCYSIDAGCGCHPRATRVGAFGFGGVERCVDGALGLSVACLDKDRPRHTGPRLQGRNVGPYFILKSVESLCV